MHILNNIWTSWRRISEKYEEMTTVARVKKETLYFILFDLYLVVQVFSESQLNTVPVVESLLFCLRVITLIMLMIQAALTEGTHIGSKLSAKEIVICIAVGLSIVHDIWFDGGQVILGIMLVVIGSTGKPLKRIFKNALISLVAAYLFVMTLCGVGLLSDNVDIRWLGNQTGSFFAGEYYRHSYGFLHSNQIPLMFMLLVFVYAGVRAERLTVLETAVAIWINWLIFKGCGARVSLLLVIGFLSCFWFIRICMAKFKLKLKWLGIIGYAAYPLALLFSLLGSYLYNDSAFWKAIDLVLNNRLNLSHKLLEVYPVSLLGYGKYAGTYSGLGNATADNGYVLLFLQAGILITVMILVLHEYMMHVCIKKKNTALVMCLIFVAIENLINAHFPSFKLLPLYCIIVNCHDPFLSQSGSMDAEKIRFLPSFAGMEKKLGIHFLNQQRLEQWKDKFRRKHKSDGE